jgi:hypothetical protein
MARYEMTKPITTPALIIREVGVIGVSNTPRTVKRTGGTLIWTEVFKDKETTTASAKGAT